MSEIITADAVEAPVVSDKEPTYVEDDSALRAVVTQDASGNAKVTCAILVNKKSNKRTLVREGDAKTGQELIVPCAAIRGGVIPPRLVQELQQKGEVYDPALHLPFVAEFLGLSVADLYALTDADAPAEPQPVEVPAA